MKHVFVPFTALCCRILSGLMVTTRLCGNLFG